MKAATVHLHLANRPNVVRKIYDMKKAVNQVPVLLIRLASTQKDEVRLVTRADMDREYML